MNDYKIIVCTHKMADTVRTEEPYLPVMVGKALHPDVALPEGYVADNTGDNISEKNLSYSEMTGVYWAWKNLKDVRYVGVSHYRRYFDMDVSRSNIERLLKKHEAILIKSVEQPCTNYMEICKLASSEDTYIAIDSLLELFPEYEDSAADYIFKQTQWVPCNMQITTWERFDDYCRFIFPLLGAIETRLRPYPFTRQRRVMGYLAELFTGLYYYHLKRTQRKTYYASELYSSDGNYYRGNWLFRKLLPIKKNIGRKLLIGNHILNSRIVFLRLDIITGLKQDGIMLNAMAKSKVFGPNFEKVY